MAYKLLSKCLGYFGRAAMEGQGGGKMEKPQGQMGPGFGDNLSLLGTRIHTDCSQKSVSICIIDIRDSNVFEGNGRSIPRLICTTSMFNIVVTANQFA